MNDPDLIQRVCDTVHGYLEVGNEVFEADGATFVRNRRCPRRYDANHLARVRCTTAEEIGRLLKRSEIEFADFGHRRCDVDPFTPQSFHARLVLDDYSCSDTLQQMLDGPVLASASPTEIRLVESEAEWTAYGELVALEWHERTQLEGRTPSPHAVVDFMINKRCQSPEIRHWLAYRDGSPRAYFSSWPGRHGVGMVEDLFTHPEHRHRGLATSLIAHAVADARARGAHKIIIGARADDTPKHMYAAMGFRPLLLTRQYLRISA